MSPFVGRERELRTLTEALERAIQGDGSLALVSGEAGIGKTTLVQALVREAQEHGALVFSGAAYDLSATPPYGPWLEITERYRPDDSLPEVPVVLKRGTGVGDLQSQLELFAVVRNFFIQVSEARPLVLVLEDLHWSDQATLDLLRYLARQIADQRILVIATYRDDEITRKHPLFQLLPVLVRESQAGRVELTALQAEHVTALVRTQWSLAPEDQARLTDYLLSHAEGNPLFTVETLRTLEQDGYLRATQPGWILDDITQIPIPTLVQQVIESRLSRLTEDARHFLEIAAIIGHQVNFGVWQSVAEVSEEKLLTVLDQAMELHLLESSPSGSSVDFVHALTREALYRGILSPRRRLWHRSIAGVLADSPNPVPDTVAYHYQQAEDPRAVEWLIRATNQAQRAYAFGTAAECLEAAIQILEGHADRQRQRGWLLYRLGMMNRWINPEKGAACLEEAKGVADQVGDRLLSAISRSFHGILLCFSGQVRQGLAEMEAAVIAYDELPPHERQQPTWSDEDSAYGPAPELAWPAVNPVKGTYTLWLSFVGRYEEAVKLGEQFVAEALTTDLGRQLSRGLVSGTGGVGASDNVAIHAAQLGCAYGGMAEALAMRGLPCQAATAYARAREALDSVNHHVMVSNVAADELLHVVLPYQADDCARREQLATDGEAAWTRAQGAMRGDLSPRVVRLPFLVIEGQWVEACELARGFIQSYGNVAMHMKALVAIGSIARCQGDSAAAWEQVHEGLPEGPESEPGAHLFSSAVTLQRLAATLSLDQGDLEQARAWLGAHDRWLDWNSASLGRAENQLLWARYYQLNGDITEASKHAERSLELASAPRQPLALIAIHRFLGELATQAREPHEAKLHLEQALDLAEACAAPFERALTMLAQAELEIAYGKPTDARTLLKEVRRVCTALKARPTLDRIDELLTRTRARGTESRFGLSPREVEVLQLIVQGMHDKDIADELYISPRTVMQHVSSILRKLDVESRTAAATRAVREGFE